MCRRCSSWDMASTRLPGFRKRCEASRNSTCWWSVISERKDGTYLLPACTSFEMDGSRTASNRSLQWGEKIVDPVFESKNDYDTMYMLARKFGFADGMS